MYSSLVDFPSIFDSRTFILILLHD